MHVFNGLIRQSAVCCDLSNVIPKYSLHRLAYEYDDSWKCLDAMKVSKTLTKYKPMSFCNHSISLLHPWKILTLFGSVKRILSLDKPPVVSVSFETIGFVVLFLINLSTSMT